MRKHQNNITLFLEKENEKEEDESLLDLITELKVGNFTLPLEIFPHKGNDDDQSR